MSFSERRYFSTNMSSYSFHLCGILILLLVAESLQLQCPSSSRMTTCRPQCKTDSDCFGQKCCPDICKHKSCTSINQGSTSDKYASDKYGGNKNSQSGGAGTYCGSLKCNSFQRCEMDRATNRPKCV